jgi:hypothetical protein
MTAIVQLEQAGEAAARRAFQRQIARLERELARTLAATYPRVAVTDPIAHRGPRLLSLGQLEQTRDTLAARVSETRHRVTEQRAAQHQARAKLEAMRADPRAYKGATVTNAELGLPGCTRYAVLPRFGPVGLLTGWWRVKISSGCP